jgi:hypothetical protein
VQETPSFVGNCLWNLDENDCIEILMTLAFINGWIGLGLSLWIGRGVLDLDYSEIFLSVGASNLAALVALLVTLRAERVEWIKKNFLSRSFKTWALLTGIYFSILLSISPTLRSMENLVWLFPSLVLSVGFIIIIFGPIQDHFVRQRQKMAHEPIRKVPSIDINGALEEPTGPN